MMRFVEGLVVAFLISGVLAGCRRHEEVKAGSGMPVNHLIGNAPLGPVTGAPQPAMGPAPGPGVPSPLAPPPSISSRPPMYIPTRPVADVTVHGAYQGPDGTKVEIAGVCKVTEDSVTCWDPQGRRSKDVENRVERALTAGPGFNGGSNLSFAYKKKNRVVVVKTTMQDVQPRRAPGGVYTVFGGGIFLESVGENSFGGGGMINIDDARGQPFRPGEPRVSYQARCVSVDPNVSTTSAFFGQTVQSPTQATLPLRKGASCKIEDAGLTITSISKGVSIPGSRRNMSAVGYMGGSPPGARWTIMVKLKNPQSKYRIQLMANGLFVDSKGRIVSQQEMMKQQALRSTEMAKLYNKSHSPGRQFLQPPQPNYSMVSCSQMWGTADECAYVLNANPAALKHLTAMATRSRRIELKGIRLDPR